MKEAHSNYSTLRESILEHLLTGALLRRLWERRIFDVELLRSEFDAGGYDLVLSRGMITRHIQLKASAGTTRKQNINLRLCDRPAGCVVWLIIDDDLNILKYLWFGGQPTEPLHLEDSLKIAKHTKGNSQGEKLPRPGLRVIPRSRFQELEGLDSLITRLLGET